MLLRSFSFFKDTPSTEAAPAPQQPKSALLNSIPRVGTQMAVVFWVQLVMVCLQGWTLQSIAMWHELTSYRLEKADHYKSTTRNQHEFIIYKFTDEHKNTLELRSDRSVGEHKNENKRKFNTSGSPSDNPLFVSSDVSLNQRLAADTVAWIEGPPARSQVLRTITFSGDHLLRPSLWDVMILVLVVHKGSPLYTLTRQCYWFTDSIFGILEKWAENHKNGSVTCEKRKVKQGRRRASTGSIGIVPLHHRNAGHIDQIWADFEKERRAMTQQKEEYERARTEETEKMRRLADEVRELRCRLELCAEYQSMSHLQEKERRCRSTTYDEDIHGSSGHSISFFCRS